MSLKASRLANAALTAAGGDALIYQVPAGKHAAFKLFVCNRGAGTAQIDVAVTSGGTPTAGDYIRFSYPIPSEDSEEISALGLEEGQRVYVKSSHDDVDVNIMGVLEDLAS